MSKKTTILLAEDELTLGRIVKESLQTRGFHVLWAKNGEEAFEIYNQKAPKILVLDVMMPIKDGFVLAREVRKTDQTTPIIFLTSKSQTKDVVEGFGVGGNDYLKKPFSMEELIVRIENQLQQNRDRNANKTFEIGEYIFDFPKQTLKYLDEPKITLTSREAQLLYQLVLYKNELANRSEILKKLWGNDDFFSSRSMDVFISKLRRKLQKDSKVKIINVRGFGYKLVF